VIPVFNEEENVKLLHEELTTVLKEVGRSYEIIFVDDGSSDNTFNILQSLKADGDGLKLIRFSRNFGQTAAIAAGFDYAQGEVIIPIDGDLQNEPSSIAALLAKIDEGYDVVSGWRRKRRDPFLTRRVPSFLANKLIAFITGIPLNDFGCTMKAYRREVVKDIRLYGEMHRFIPALASWRGASITEIEVKHNRRKFGRTKYGLSRTFRVILDAITVKFCLSYFTSPIQMFGLWGIFPLLIGFLSGIAVILMKVIVGMDMTGNPLLYLTVLSLIVGVQFIAMGLLGEIAIRTYYESQGKSIYVIKELRE
jgi:glycosyltransferase involved in cell wall biosynthesis